MKSLQFPETFVKLISVLEDNFSKASFRHFKVLLTAILLGHPKKTVTAGMRLFESAGHFCNPCRFMSHYVWDATRVGLSVLTLLLRCLPIEAPCFLLWTTPWLPNMGRRFLAVVCTLITLASPTSHSISTAIIGWWLGCFILAPCFRNGFVYRF